MTAGKEKIKVADTSPNQRSVTSAAEASTTIFIAEQHNKGAIFRPFLFRVSCAVCRAQNSWYTSTTELAEAAVDRAASRLSLTRLNVASKYFGISAISLCLLTVLLISFFSYVSTVVGAVLRYDPHSNDGIAALRRLENVNILHSSGEPSESMTTALTRYKLFGFAWPWNAVSNSTLDAMKDTAQEAQDTNHENTVSPTEISPGVIVSTQIEYKSAPIQHIPTHDEKLAGALGQHPDMSDQRNQRNQRNHFGTETIPADNINKPDNKTELSIGGQIRVTTAPKATEDSVAATTTVSHKAAHYVVKKYSEAIHNFVLSYRYESSFIFSTVLFGATLCLIYMVTQWSYEGLLHQLTKAAAGGVKNQMSLQVRGMLEADFKNYIAAVREIFVIDPRLTIDVLRETHEILRRNFDTVTKINMDYELGEEGVKLRPPGWRPPKIRRGLFGEVQKSRRAAVQQQLRKVRTQWRRKQFFNPPVEKSPAELLQSKLHASKRSLLELIGPENIVRYIGIHEYTSMKTARSKHIALLFLFRFPMLLTVALLVLCCIGAVIVANISLPFLQNWSGPILLSPYFACEWAAVLLTLLNVIYLIILNFAKPRIQLMEKILGHRVDSLVSFANILIASVWSASVEASLSKYVTSLTCDGDDIENRAVKAVIALRQHAQSHANAPVVPAGRDEDREKAAAVKVVTSDGNVFRYNVLPRDKHSVEFRWALLENDVAGSSSAWDPLNPGQSMFRASMPTSIEGSPDASTRVETRGDLFQAPAEIEDSDIPHLEVLDEFGEPVYQPPTLGLKREYGKSNAAELFDRFAIWLQSCALGFPTEDEPIAEPMGRRFISATAYPVRDGEGSERDHDNAADDPDTPNMPNNFGTYPSEPLLSRNDNFKSQQKDFTAALESSTGNNTDSIELVQKQGGASFFVQWCSRDTRPAATSEASAAGESKSFDSNKTIAASSSRKDSDCPYNNLVNEDVEAALLNEYNAVSASNIWVAEEEGAFTSYGDGAPLMESKLGQENLSSQIPPSKLPESYGQIGETDRQTTCSPGLALSPSDDDDFAIHGFPEGIAPTWKVQPPAHRGDKNDEARYRGADAIDELLRQMGLSPAIPSN